MTDLDAHLHEYLAHLAARDSRAAVELAVRLADEGVPVATLLVDLVAAAQREIGERWYCDDASIADEHAATAIAEAVVGVLTGTASAVRAAGAVHVVVCCASGEWHTLPARLFSEVLRAKGHDVTYLGPSIPPSHLARFLARLADVDLLAVSCATPLALEGVLAYVEVAHDLGLPVIAGGRALGPDDHRATVLGADLWAPDADAAAALLARPRPDRLRAPTADVGTALELALGRDAHVEAAMEELGRRLPMLARFDSEQLARTREDLGYILRFAEATILTRDPRVFEEFLAWLERLLVLRGLPDSVVPTALEALVATGPAGPLTDLLTGALTP